MIEIPSSERDPELQALPKPRETAAKNPTCFTAMKELSYGTTKGNGNTGKMKG
jgi:hypothetical protein